MCPAAPQLAVHADPRSSSLVAGLPSIVLAPAKFAFSFTAGSLCNMAAMGALRGWAAQLQSMLSRDRMLYTASYLASMLGACASPTPPRPPRRSATTPPRPLG
jgi:hypothetical protein